MNIMLLNPRGLLDDLQYVPFTQYHITSNLTSNPFKTTSHPHQVTYHTCKATELQFIHTNPHLILTQPHLIQTRLHLIHIKIHLIHTKLHFIHNMLRKYHPCKANLTHPILPLTLTYTRLYNNRAKPHSIHTKLHIIIIQYKRCSIPCFCRTSWGCPLIHWVLETPQTFFKSNLLNL